MARFLFIFNLVLFFSCGPQADSGSVQEQAQEAPKRLSIGMRRGPDSLNPYLSTSLEGDIIAKRLFPQLFIEKALEKPGMPQLTPSLISEWSWLDPSQTALKISIRKGLKWADGHPLTTADVAYTLEIQKSDQIGWISGDRKAHILSWDTVDDWVMEIKFSKPSVYNLLDLNEGVIVPKHFFARVDPANWLAHSWNEEIVTFGPYTIAEWSPDERLILKPLDGSEFPTLGFAFVRDSEALYQLLKSKELDYAWGLPVSRISDLASIGTPVSFPDLSFGFIGWNPLDPAAYSETEPKTVAELNELKRSRPHRLFGDPRVRKALTLAMNREAYLEKFWRGSGSVPVNPWAAGLPYRLPALQSLPFDTQAATELLQEAGWSLTEGKQTKDGVPFEFSVICNSGSPIREAYLLAIKEDLAKMGITMNITMMESGLYVQACSARNFDAMFGSFHTGTRPDLGSLYSDQEALGGFNFCSWTGQTEKIQRVQDTADPAGLDQALAELEEAFSQDVPLTMLYRGMTVAAAAKSGLKVKANAIDYLFEVEHW